MLALELFANVIRLSFLVLIQVTFTFARFAALLARLCVNVITHEVKDAFVCEIVMKSQQRSALE